MKTAIYPAALALAAMTACTQAPVDRAMRFDGPIPASAAADTASCKQIALSYDDPDLRTQRNVVSGVSALAVMADADDDHKLEGAIVGGLLGAAVGEAERRHELSKEQRQVLIRCMQGRGYKVVG